MNFADIVRQRQEARAYTEPSEAFVAMLDALACVPDHFRVDGFSIWRYADHGSIDNSKRGRWTWRFGISVEVGGYGTYREDHAKRHTAALRAYEGRRDCNTDDNEAESAT